MPGQNNKVRFGLKKLMYAVITESSGSVSYGTVKELPGAVSLTRTPVGERTPFYADDREYFTADSNAGYEGSIEIAMLPDEFLTDVLGFTKDNNNNLFENKDATIKNVALMFEFAADAKAVRHCMYNVKFKRPSLTANTKGQAVEVQPDSIEFTATAAIDTNMISAKTTADSTNYDTWYESVPVPVTA